MNKILKSDEILALLNFADDSKQLVATLTNSTGYTYARNVFVTVRKPSGEVRPDTSLPVVTVVPNGNSGFASNIAVQDIVKEDGYVTLSGPLGEALFHLVDKNA